MTLKRSDIPWRELPHLRIEEAAEIAGVSRRTVSAAIAKDQLVVRHLGRIPMIPTGEFRRWIGEDVAEADPQCEATIPIIARSRAERLLRKVG